MLDEHGLLFDVQGVPVAVVTDRIPIRVSTVPSPKLARQQVDPCLSLPDVDQFMDEDGLKPQRGSGEVARKLPNRPGDPVLAKPSPRHEGAIERPGRLEEPNRRQIDRVTQCLPRQSLLARCQAPDHDAPLSPVGPSHSQCQGSKA